MGGVRHFSSATVWRELWIPDLPGGFDRRQQIFGHFYHARVATGTPYIKRLRVTFRNVGYPHFGIRLRLRNVRRRKVVKLWKVLLATCSGYET